MFDSWIRHTAFWSLDVLKGNIKKMHYEDIARKFGEIDQNALKSILCYAVKHVPGYAGLDEKNLCSFPVMTKQKYIVSGREKYMSDEYKRTKLHHVYTSGSTGTPFEVIQDQNKRNRVICDLIHCHDAFNWKLGDRYVFIRNWVSNYKQSKLKSVMQNVHNVNITAFDDHAKDELFKYLSRNRGTVLFGYSSAIIEFANYVETRGYDTNTLRIKTIVCDSDELSAENRIKVKGILKAPVHNRYDNEENGLLGICRDGDSCFHLNTASLYFEVLSIDSDTPTKPGEIGRVVVTDLYNRAMPLIRYDLGDLAITSDLPGEIKIFDELSGRATGVLTNIDGRLVSNVSISGAMEPFTSILKYQIQQDKKHYRVFYAGFLTDNDKNQVYARMKTCFGQVASIELRNVQNIPSNKNGKYQTTVRIDS